MNDTVTLPVLQQPLTEAAHVASLQQCTQYALCIHDWSRLAFKHANKRDTYAMTHQHDVGYDLQSSLLVSDRDGQPLAPVVQRLVSRDGSYCTYEAAASGHVREHLDEVTHCIHTLEQQGFAWYYWRWKIESFFKLLKSAGQQLESWQQPSA